MRKQKWQTYPQRHNKSGVTVCQARVECQAEIISYRRLNLAILRIKYFVGNFSKFGELIRVQWQSMEGLLHIIITFSPTTNTHLALDSPFIIWISWQTRWIASIDGSRITTSNTEIHFTRTEEVFQLEYEWAEATQYFIQCVQNRMRNSIESGRSVYETPTAHLHTWKYRNRLVW